MAEPRRYIGVRISEQGHRYIQLVADRDRVNYSEALRRLLAVGAKTDMEAHDDSRPQRQSPLPGADQGSGIRDVRPNGDGRRDRHSDPSSDGLSHVPHSDLGDAVRTHAGIGDAIGNLHRAGLNPSAVTAEDDGPSAA